MRLKTSKGKKVTYSLICVFVVFVREENIIEKREKSPQCKCTKYRCPHN